jgi:hypothetical protein
MFNSSSSSEMALLDTTAPENQAGFPFRGGRSANRHETEIATVVPSE